MDEAEKKRKKAEIFAAWRKKNPRTKEEKAKKAASERQWRRDNPEMSARQARERYQKSPVDTVARVRKWRMEHPEQWVRIQRASNLRKYGMTIEDYEALLGAQGSRCAVCMGIDSKVTNGLGKKWGFSVDHDHVTGMVRGLLCGPCNAGLGGFGDNAERLSKAIAYLKASPPVLLGMYPGSTPYTKKEGSQKYMRDYYLKRQFGITSADYDFMHRSQGGKCAICDGEDSKSPHSGGYFAVDHHHVTGVVRGLLCFPCNTGVGNFMDDHGLIATAITYLAHATTKHYAPSRCEKRKKGRPRSP